MINNCNADLSLDPSIGLLGTKSSRPFAIKGHLHSTYFFYVKKRDRIVSIKSNQFKQRYLLTIAGIDYWREHFGTTDKRKKSGVDWNEVEIALITLCCDEGEFQGAVMRTKVIRYPSTVATMAKNIEGA